MNVTSLYTGKPKNSCVFIYWLIMFILLQWSRTKLAVSPRYACNHMQLAEYKYTCGEALLLLCVIFITDSVLSFSVQLHSLESYLEAWAQIQGRRHDNLGPKILLIRCLRATSCQLLAHIGTHTEIIISVKCSFQQNNNSLCWALLTLRNRLKAADCKRVHRHPQR